MRMKNIIAFLSVMLAVCFSGCSKENVPAGEEVSSGEGIELSISLNGEYDMDSRSELTSSEPMHHIEHMYAYVFAADGNELTIDNAKCIYEEKLPWTGTAEGSSVFRCRMKPENFDYNTPDREYLVMVVGVDNNKDTYAFPWDGDSDASDIHLGMNGKKLSDVQMVLASGVESSQMAYTEMFAGFRKFTTSESLVKVKLTRRIAGVICYLTDIPAKINEYHIIGAELHWSGGLNASGVLKPAELANDKECFEDLSSDDKANPSTTLLAKINLKEMGAEADASGKLLYIPAINQEGVLKTLPNTAFMGAYMLPVKTDGQFIIKLVGEIRNADDSVQGNEYVFAEKDTDGYYEINNSNGNVSYPICADYIYNIGYKPYTTDTDFDVPLSLKGKSFEVNVSEWDTISVNVDFPNTQLGILFDTGKTANFRYDCASATDNTLTIKVLSADYNEKQWTLTTVADWLYFVNDDGKAVQTISGIGEKKITIKVDDYIENRTDFNNYNPDEDFRTATVTLTVAGTPISSNSFIRQWNALIVPTVDEDGESIGNIAFKRLDMGYTFDSDGSVKLIDGEKGEYIWGFQDTGSSTVFYGVNNISGDKGLDNYRQVEKIWGDDHEKWDLCAINRAYEQQLTVNTRYWYLPARIEMHALMRMHKGYSSANLPKEVNWWSSSAVGSVSIIDDEKLKGYYSNTDAGEGNKWYDNKSLKMWRGKKARIRQVCVLY